MILNHVKKLSSVLHALCIQYHLMQCWAKQTEGNFCKNQVEIPAEYIIVTMLAMCFDCQEPRVCHSHMPRWSTREEMKSGRFFSSDCRKAMRMAWSDDTLDGAQVTLVSCWHPNNGTRVPSLSDWEGRTRVHKRHWIDLYRAFKSWVYGSSLSHQSHRCHPFWSHSCKIWLLLEIDASFLYLYCHKCQTKSLTHCMGSQYYRWANKLTDEWMKKWIVAAFSLPYKFRIRKGEGSTLGKMLREWL